MKIVSQNFKGKLITLPLSFGYSALLHQSSGDVIKPRQTSRLKLFQFKGSNSIQNRRTGDIKKRIKFLSADMVIQNVNTGDIRSRYERVFSHDS